MPISKKSVDVKAKDWERYDKLKEIIEMILQEKSIDGGNNKKDKRRWILWYFLYIMWWEGTRATTRTQDGGGPGRGFMQFEPATLWDLLRRYILGLTPGLLQNLADAAGVTKDQMSKAVRDFVKQNETNVLDKNDKPIPETDPDGNELKNSDGSPKHKKKGKNEWPKTTPAKNIEKWLLESDSFGIKLMRYFFLWKGDRELLPNQDLTKPCHSDAAKETHAENWAEYWKRLHGSDEDRKKAKDKFKKRAKDLDKVVAECKKKEEEKKKKEGSKKSKIKKAFFIGVGFLIGLIVLSFILTYTTDYVTSTTVTIIAIDDVGNCLGIDQNDNEVNLGMCGGKPGDIMHIKSSKP